MVYKVREKTGWATIDEIKMSGDYRGRQCTALSQGLSYQFFIRFDSKGDIQAFEEKKL